MELKLKGMSQMLRNLEAKRQRVSGPGMKRAIRAGARVIKAAMVERAPVLDARTAGSTALEPGSLRGGIRVYMPKEATPLEALIGPSAKVAHVARFVEYGHRMVSGGYSKVLPDGRMRGPGKAAEVDVPAHPFLRPAFEESVGGAEEAIVDSLKKTLAEGVS